MGEGLQLNEKLELGFPDSRKLGAGFPILGGSHFYVTGTGTSGPVVGL